ncbi:DUF4810 domain-containing protein [Campylobacter showae]|uniref:Lipoprotein n=1 Tax=Campylobacter showae CC57C TaxID=1073353 RepID=M3JCV4_9BACT|nr:DUF4810 domain-containing protein [Campylobacter showae]EMG30522.1 lipoprotein [Campylobacter showae CC57C]
MRFKTLANFALASAAALLISGCADDSPRQLYYWDGTYTSSVYEYLIEEGDAGAQIAALEESLQKAYQRAAKVPPGLYAHLGLLYLSQGNGAKFKAYVEKEAELYPESRDYAMFLLNQNSKTAGTSGKTEANLSEQTKEKAGTSNLNDKSSNLSEQTSKQNLKNKQTKPAKTSKTAKGSQNEK